MATFSVSDVEIVLIYKLQEYIHVLSRPMAAAKARRNVWTNVYLHNMVNSFGFSVASILQLLLL